MDGNEGIRSCITLATSMGWSQLDWTGTRQNGGKEAFALQLLYICYDCFATAFVCGFLTFTHFFVLRCFLSSRPLYMLFFFRVFIWKKWWKMGTLRMRQDGERNEDGSVLCMDGWYPLFSPFFPFSFHCLSVTKIRRKQYNKKSDQKKRWKRKSIYIHTFESMMNSWFLNLYHHHQQFHPFRSSRPASCILDPWWRTIPGRVRDDATWRAGCLFSHGNAP